MGAKPPPSLQVAHRFGAPPPVDTACPSPRPRLPGPPTRFPGSPRARDLDPQPVPRSVGQGDAHCPHQTGAGDLPCGYEVASLKSRLPFPSVPQIFTSHDPYRGSRAVRAAEVLRSRGGAKCAGAIPVNGGRAALRRAALASDSLPGWPVPNSGQAAPCRREAGDSADLERLVAQAAPHAARVADTEEVPKVQLQPGTDRRWSPTTHFRRVDQFRLHGHIGSRAGRGRKKLSTLTNLGPASNLRHLCYTRVHLWRH